MKVIENNKRIAKVWVDDLGKVEEQAVNQIKTMLQLRPLFNHIAIMPDTHLGKGAVVGGVVALKNAVCPNIVGVDIGCGMSAYRTSVKLNDEMGKDFWRAWKSIVDRSVPTGFHSHKERQQTTIGSVELQIELKAKELQKFMDEKVPYQVGTLGGGNHFLEAQVDEEGYIWFMVHSGSRHTGLQIAEYYNKKAKELNTKYFTDTPTDLWFLPLDEQYGQDYLYDMNWAIGFALESRWRMLEEMVRALDKLLDIQETQNVRKSGINIHHNFAGIEHHFGHDVVVHRKGATQARDGQIGIIPGSMGTSSYIVSGKGNADSFASCSHGAGRTMSRTQARKQFTSEDIRKSLEGTYTKPSEKHLDEIPMAYKNIDDVIDAQRDLIAVAHTLKPIITIKGEGFDD